MTDLEALRSRIPGYADYGDEASRHEVDKQVRAYLGEALAAARLRLDPGGEVRDRLEGLLLRCEFTNQRAIRIADHARFDPPLVERVHALDRRIIDSADRIRAAASSEELATDLDTAARLLDERFGMLADAPSRERG